MDCLQRRRVSNERELGPSVADSSWGVRDDRGPWMDQGAPDNLLEIARVKRFDEEVERPGSHGGDAVAHRAFSGENDNRRPGPQLARPPQNLEAVRVRHLEMGDHEVDR